MLTPDAFGALPQLSPNNVLLNAAGNSQRFTVAVADFGLARICYDSGGKRTETVGTVRGSLKELIMRAVEEPCDWCCCRHGPGMVPQ